MYSIDEKDNVIELTDVPQSDTGAPRPAVLTSEDFVLLAYYLQEAPTYPIETTSQMSGLGSKEACALVRFSAPVAHMFGPPGDETFHGHPLYERGLQFYSVSEVLHSSWIRALERINSVHRQHSPARYRKYRHFIFVFHDSVFECVAEDFRLSTHRGSVMEVLLASVPNGET